MNTGRTMRHRNRARGVLLIGAVLLSASATGCTARPALLSSVVGKTLAQAEQALATSGSFVIYDLTKPIAGKQATYSGKQATDLYTVVVACGQTSQVEPSQPVALGIVKNDSYTKAVRMAAHEGRYRSLLVECVKS